MEAAFLGQSDLDPACRVGCFLLTGVFSNSCSLSRWGSDDTEGQHVLGRKSVSGSLGRAAFACAVIPAWCTARQIPLSQSSSLYLLSK